MVANSYSRHYQCFCSDIDIITYNDFSKRVKCWVNMSHDLSAAMGKDLAGGELAMAAYCD